MKSDLLSRVILQQPLSSTKIQPHTIPNLEPAYVARRHLCSTAVIAEGMAARCDRHANLLMHADSTGRRGGPLWL